MAASILGAADPAARDVRSCLMTIERRCQMANPIGSMSGLSDQEAKAFHGIFMRSFLIFTAIAVVAHFLVWQWRPWIAP